MDSTLLPDLAIAYIEWRSLLGGSRGTLAKRRESLRRFIRWLELVCEVVRIEQLQRSHLERFQKHLHEYRTKRGTPLHPISINGFVVAVHGFLKWLARRDLASACLYQALQFVKEPDTLPTSVLSHAQVRLELNRIPAQTPLGYRDRTILELLYSTGVRAAELIGVGIADIDLGNACLRVKGKGNKERMVPVGRSALRCLETYLKAVRPFLCRDAASTALFFNTRGYPLSQRSLNDMVLLRSRTSNLPVHYTPHTFRRSCATELIRGNANPYHVKELLGHASLDSLRPYTRLTIRDLKVTHARCHPRERDDG